MLDRILDAATDNLRFAKILVQMGLDPNNVTWDTIFNRLLEIFLHNITLANMFALVGAIFFVATLLTHTMVPLRVANMIGCAFFAIFGALTGAVTTFLLYLLMFPINAYRVCAENLIRVDDVTETRRLAGCPGFYISYWPFWRCRSSRRCDLKPRMRYFGIS